MSGNLPQDVEHFLTLNRETDTWTHSLKVAAEAVRIARLYGANPDMLEQAALLHDISNVVPVSEMLAVAEALGLHILADEYHYPRIVHQKLSPAMAEQIFGISEELILDAIECHTTLKPKASLTAKILFIADKLSFDLAYNPRSADIRRLVDEGQLDQGVLIYLDTIREQRTSLKLLHPWMLGAREELLAAAQG